MARTSSFISTVPGLFIWVASSLPACAPLIVTCVAGGRWRRASGMPTRATPNRRTLTRRGMPKSQRLPIYRRAVTSERAPRPRAAREVGPARPRQIAMDFDAIVRPGRRSALDPVSPRWEGCSSPRAPSSAAPARTRLHSDKDADRERHLDRIESRLSSKSCASVEQS